MNTKHGTRKKKEHKNKKVNRFTLQEATLKLEDLASKHQGNSHYAYALKERIESLEPKKNKPAKEDAKVEPDLGV